ncbi:unnamed protein product [Clavelina lepadiformis]|uniref:Major facilitator superfamily (MFS) profile domain-containing protein n=1 Tax=Clavelina lepadiformis TaxID=159417 RepID=A0ABP0EXK8_CLALP
MTDENENVVVETQKGGFYIRQRYVIAALGFFGLFNVSCMRHNLSFAIVAMVNTTAHNHTGTGTFHWNSKDQGLLLGSYFYGYAAGNLIGGWMASKYGFRNVYGITIFLSAIFTVATSLAAHTNFYLAVVCRALVGLFHVRVYPSMNYAFSNWAPPFEVSILSSVTVSGLTVGLLVIFPLVGMILQFLNWEAVFSITGGVAIFGDIFFFIFASDSPSNNKRISERERLYIKKCIGNREAYSKPKSTPWKSIFTSKCMWGLFACHSADAFVQTLVPVILPTYLSNVLYFDITQSGLVMVLPFLMQGVVIIIGSQITDFLRRKRLITTTRIRKINSSISLLISELCLVITGYVGGNHYAVIGLFTTNIVIVGLAYPGYVCTPLDIAPRYSGIIFGVSNSIASLVAFLGPFLAGYIVTDQHSVTLWQNLFWLTFGLNIIGTILYVILASGVEQTWAKKDTRNKDDKKALEIEKEKFNTSY